MSNMLHIVNKSPFERNALETCMRVAKPGASILLIEDAVFAAQANTAYTQNVSGRLADFSFYVLGPDISARGLVETPLLEGVKVVDYEGFVDLVTEHDTSQSWL